LLVCKEIVGIKYIGIRFNRKEKFQSCGEIESMQEFEFYSEEVIYGMGIQTTND